jgi:cellulose synthase/poly-beta-1,6-N-acetylglucosamine synthase-like glycosyltransferase
MGGYNIKYCNTITARTEAPDEFRDLITQRYRWSRGMIQSIIKAVKTLRTNFTSRGFFVVAYMFFETLIIPIINFTFVIITLEYALLYDTIQLMGPYFIGLTVMDLTLCLYAIVMEKEVTILFFLGIFNRVTYGLALEVIRFFSIFDELFSLPMKWGVLTRKGMDDSGN